MEDKDARVLPLRRDTGEVTPRAVKPEPTARQRDYWRQVQRLRAERDGLRPVG